MEEEGEEDDGDLYEELSDGLLDAIVEKLTVDMGAYALWLGWSFLRRISQTPDGARDGTPPQHRSCRRTRST
jgi:hypothetical protein